MNLQAELFSSAAYLCLQQESMSVNALSRLLETVAKLIKHATAMSTILTTELFQARYGAAIARGETVHRSHGASWFSGHYSVSELRCGLVHSCVNKSCQLAAISCQ